MERWTCPICDRVFGKDGQRHTCEPAVTVEDYFADARPFEQPVFDAVMAGLDHLDDLIVDPIGIGILLKNGPMFAELRPKTKWTALGFNLGRIITSGRMSRQVVEHGAKYFHVINISNPDHIDNEIIDWLVEAYHLAGGADHSPPTDDMVPSDVDDTID